MATTPIVGLASNDPVPGHYVQVSFAQGQASNGQTDYAAILQGNCLSGSYVSGSGLFDNTVFGPNTPDVLDTEQNAIDLFGAGSELHAMFRDFRAINKTTTLYAIAIPEGAGAKASGVIAMTGSASAAGTVRCWIGDEQIDAGFASGDSTTTQASALASAINSLAHLPVTASPSTNVVTLTAKQRGLRGNRIRYSAKVLPAQGTGVTVNATTRQLMAGGSGADSNANALSTISSARYYYYVPAVDDSTQLSAISSQLDSTAVATVGLRQRCVAGSNESSVSNVQTIAIAQNQPRMEIVHQLESDLTPARLAAKGAAVYSLMEQALGAQYSLNFNSFGSDAFSSQFWKVPAALSGAKLSRSQVKSHLMNGVTPIGTTAQGRTYLVRRVTTKSLNGSNSDYRVRDACKVTVSDKFADDLLAQAAARFGGKVIGDDPANGQRASSGSSPLQSRWFGSRPANQEPNSLVRAAARLESTALFPEVRMRFELTYVGFADCQPRLYPRPYR